MTDMRTAKRRKLSPPDERQAPRSKPLNEKFAIRAAEWNLEQDYETRPRRLDKKAKKKERLPIRTTEGWVEQEEPEALEESPEEGNFSVDGEDVVAEEESTVQGPQEVSPQVTKVSTRQQILEAKEELARTASLINEDPEEHIGSLKKLKDIASSENITVRKLALATQLAIYKDIIPGYRIRPLSEDDMKAKLSKDVRKLRNFEQSLVMGYQSYINDLHLYSKGDLEGTEEQIASLKSVAVSCACNLLLAVPHFNFRAELLKILAGKLSGRNIDANFVKCRETLETLFKDDEDGNASLEAVTMLTKMMKSRDYRIDESVMNTFLHLRLLSEFSQTASTNHVDREDQPEQQPKLSKKKREFRTKKLRKQLREQKALDKEMKEADAAVSHEERDKLQAETLKLVFVTYFRILKARKPHLMSAVLEGLAKYAHLINQDFFGDILEALKSLIQNPTLTSNSSINEDSDSEDPDSNSTIPQTHEAIRQSLLCTTTAFTLLQHQSVRKSASPLHLDLSFFISHLYTLLLPLSLSPSISSSPFPPSLSSAPSPPPLLPHLLPPLQSILLPSSLSPSSLSPIRLAAFTHQILLLSLHFPSPASLALLKLLNEVVRNKTLGKRVAALWNTEERRGDGVMDLTGESGVEGANPYAGTAWEGEVLRWHWDPRVRGLWREVEGRVGEVGR
ncbi:MAG: hypothetical protein M1820_004710 [Bogoriella megaspora]|nr:MAG: hypothetical protein M1820_004710 [Bogoriella megaspora]